MKAHFLQVTLLVLAAVLAIGAAVSTFANEHAPASEHTAAPAQEGGEGEGAGAGGSGVDVVPVALWTAVGVVAGAVVFATFYTLKRRVGGFPTNPAWVAPITIMRSQDLPGEGDFGDQTPSSQAHAEH